MFFFSRNDTLFVNIVLIATISCPCISSSLFSKYVNLSAAISAVGCTWQFGSLPSLTSATLSTSVQPCFFFVSSTANMTARFGFELGSAGPARHDHCTRKQDEGRRLWKKAWGFNLFPMFISPPGDKPYAIKNISYSHCFAVRPHLWRHLKDKMKEATFMWEAARLCKLKMQLFYSCLCIEEMYWFEIFNWKLDCNQIGRAVRVYAFTQSVQSPSWGKLTYLNKNEKTYFWPQLHGKPVSSGNENASLELSSYWKLANLWPCNTSAASRFVTCWKLLESETIGEDLLLTSSFSEDLIVDLPRLNPLWDCSQRDLQCRVYIHKNTHWIKDLHTQLVLSRERHTSKIRFFEITFLHSQAQLNVDYTVKVNAFKKAKVRYFYNCSI